MLIGHVRGASSSNVRHAKSPPGLFWIPALTPAVAYIRVSRLRQGRSGLGLEAQHAAIAPFAEAYGYRIAEVYSEVETGRGFDALERRPQLAAAIKAARKLGNGRRSRAAPVIVAKLDRMFRPAPKQGMMNGLMRNQRWFSTQIS